jgi:hypothetical protein
MPTDQDTVIAEPKAARAKLVVNERRPVETARASNRKAP